MAALEPPPFLNDEQRRIWIDTTEQLLGAGATSRVNTDALLAFVTAVATHRRASELLNRTDVLIETNGRALPNPALAIQHDAALVIEKFTKQFGLNRRSAAPMAAAAPMAGQGRWCDQHNRWECTSPRSRGRGQCHGIAVVGLGRCVGHAGVKISEDARHILAVEQRRNPIAGEPLDIGPAEALLWRVRVLAGEVSRLDEMIAGMEADDLVWGVVSEETHDTDAGDVTTTKSAARLNTWVVLRSQREDMLARACEAALRANIEERLVRIAEQQGAAIHKLLITVITDFGIARDDPRIPQIIPMRLRELTA